MDMYLDYPDSQLWHTPNGQDDYEVTKVYCVFFYFQTLKSMVP